MPLRVNLAHQLPNPVAQGLLQVRSTQLNDQTVRQREASAVSSISSSVGTLNVMGSSASSGAFSEAAPCSADKASRWAVRHAPWTTAGRRARPILLDLDPETIRNDCENLCRGIVPINEFYPDCGALGRLRIHGYKDRICHLQPPRRPLHSL